MLKLEHVSVTFHPGTQLEKKALTDVSVTIHDGDFVTILGSNGAGKSTFFNVIAGKIPVTSGKVFLDEEDITEQKEHIRARQIGRLFQNPAMGTAGELSVEENLALAYSHSQRGMFSRAVTNADREFFAEHLKTLDMGLEDRLKTPIGLLSGGQRQAVALMMAVLNPPKILLLDEHTAALDPKSAHKILEITNQLIKQEQITALMITHNMKDALENGSRLLIFHDGRITKDFSGAEKSALKPEDVIHFYEV
ncbi:ABC transporter ATP-binding protein [Catenisphaera adipataccumulans]|jgi:putative ABC transport system ATP-binding protein|uniref:Putative ABC transport system ATP-binding protein n=1 Tax=Catenisphaera adipataccumulans TaxID=700500 RepID=A0A7W8FUE1_9FIRM|nr:ATP-binding cassette domain-containing protein [Catenisphaera adipataccumulans]MBB5182003.1 putative ABC transport system ATP-binding protein [Catenisphaera adipataccumulans]